MKIILAYRESELGEAWNALFAEQADVSIVDSDITTIDCDAIVSPANSFGFMDGGLDLALSKRFGWKIEKRLRAAIAELPERELLIGRTIVLPTDDERVPWLISAPTMRVPMSFNIATSINAYLAMKAILIAAKTHPKIESVAIPGLCTGVGKMPPEISCKQMFAAFNEVVLGNESRFVDFGEAQKQQALLNPNGMIWDF